MKEKIVGFRAIAAADDVDVARALRHHQSGARTIALDQGVDSDRRAVNALVEPALADAIDYASCQLSWRAQRLGLGESLSLVVKANQVGECSTNIDRNKDHVSICGGALVLLWDLRLSWRGTKPVRTICAIRETLNATKFSPDHQCGGGG